ncbi:iron chelate uptake ABC transporter family permease subunit [Actinoplanes bogorensis]|uniref:Iron chelate uptake ABC transporter family permease subunit n=1 Tax=Paractinoplanes bogorensis TaxID=1610840 RepID=A0ABS5YZJ4_9ACTN|nr:iron chelate uptake ABC transporter family permease subunit [Actinoplanes bogorensis]MBU2668863.1 iron chelate uptake ABC transporter family permease subunit [Actinoplanes bogorensis]
MPTRSRRAVIRAGGLSLRLHPRTGAIGLVLLLIALGVAFVNLTTGDSPVPVAEVLKSLAGKGTAGTDFIVYELRLPRVLVTLLVGVALGASGAVFQSLTRNPLGSPDFVGLTTGAASGALIVMLITGGGGLRVGAGAIIGCVITAVAVYLLAFRRGVQPFRLVLMGIGVSALLEAFNSYLIYRAQLNEAIAAQVWLIGSVNGRGWTEVVIVAVTVVVLVPLILYYGRHLKVLALGDEMAVLQGVPVERSRAILALAAVGLSAGATAAAGPIAFVALAAPPLAARLSRSPDAGILPAAVMGAALLSAGDWAAQNVLPSDNIPVGVVTAALGGLYLTWLLLHERRGARA